jgi:hypothetical protein
MQTWSDRRNLVERALPRRPRTARAMLAADPQSVAASGAEAPDPAPPQTIIDWLALATLLHGVPFEYLVPYAALLPPESIRFFYLDQNWLDRLVDGAISTGVASSQDAAFNKVWYEDLYAEVDAQRATLRAGMRGEAAPAVSTNAMSGFVFRSTVVKSWPGVEIKGLAAGTELPILRLDRLSSTVLICIFSGVPDEVQFIEPGEGLHFGVLGAKGEPSYILLRGLGLGGLSAGAQIPDASSPGGYLRAPVTYRSGSGSQPGVVDVASLATSVASGIQGKAQDGLPPTGVTPSVLAIEMVRGAGLMDYKTPPQETRS